MFIVVNSHIMKKIILKSGHTVWKQFVSIPHKSDKKHFHKKFWNEEVEEEEKERGQCDQMVICCFQFWPFTTLKLSPI